jgi:DNA-3-methyladenine glycosylase II
MNQVDYSIALATLKQSDPILAEVIDRIGECRLGKSQQTGDLLHSLCESIIYQQLSGKAAAAIHRRFLALYIAQPDVNQPGVNQPHPNQLNSNQPDGNQPHPNPSLANRPFSNHHSTEQPILTAVNILNTPDEQLRGVGLSRSKVAYIKDLAQKVLDGLPTLTELEAMEDEAIIRTLIQVKGIGRWTAQMLLMFRLHRWDVLPVDDLGIRAGVQRLYGLAELPNKKVVEQIAAPWQPYRTIACWYIWQSLDTN